MSAQGSPSGAEERGNRFRRRLSALQELMSLYYSPQETDLHGGAHTEVWNPLHVLIGELRVEPSPVLLFRERAEEADKWERDHGGDVFDVSETRWTLSVDSSPERGVAHCIFASARAMPGWPLCRNGSLHGLPGKLEGIGHRK